MSYTHLILLKHNWFQNKQINKHAHQLFQPALHRASWTMSGATAQPGPPHWGGCVAFLQFLQPKCRIKCHPCCRNKWKSPSETFSEHRLVKWIIQVYKTRRKQKEDFPKHLPTGKTLKRQQAATIWYEPRPRWRRFLANSLWLWILWNLWNNDSHRGCPNP